MLDVITSVAMFYWCRAGSTAQTWEIYQEGSVNSGRPRSTLWSWVTRHWHFCPPAHPGCLLGVVLLWKLGQWLRMEGDASRSRCSSSSSALRCGWVHPFVGGGVRDWGWLVVVEEAYGLTAAVWGKWHLLNLGILKKRETCAKKYCV